jgi:hypothetical protein
MDEEARMNQQARIDRAAPRVALVTCAQVPELDADSRRLLGPLAARGVASEPVVWDDPTVDWAGFDLAVVRSCWDYVPRRSEFLAWARSVPRLANPPEVLAWNTDKRYLQDPADAGVPVVPKASAKCGVGWIVSEDWPGTNVWQVRTPAMMRVSAPMTPLEARACPHIIAHPRRRAAAGCARCVGTRPVQ